PLRRRLRLGGERRSEEGDTEQERPARHRLDRRQHPTPVGRGPYAGRRPCSSPRCSAPASTAPAGSTTARCGRAEARRSVHHPGLARLRRLRWPFTTGVLDEELCAATGLEGVKAVYAARGRSHGATFFGVFDCL